MHRFLLWFGHRLGHFYLTILILAASATSLSAETLLGPVAWSPDGSIYAHYMGKLQRLTPEPKGVRALSDSIPFPGVIESSGDGALVAASFSAGGASGVERPHVTVYDAVRRRPLYSILVEGAGTVPEIAFAGEEIFVRCGMDVSIWDRSELRMRSREEEEGSVDLSIFSAKRGAGALPAEFEIATAERLERWAGIETRKWAALVFSSTTRPDTTGATRVEVRAIETGEVVKSFRTAKRGTISEREYIAPLSVALDPNGESIFIQWPRAGCQLFRFSDWKLVAHWR
ncbi:MAG: hypothetical protein HKN20_06555 [Gemmatimonadetes bacterium]|nr:hypothetical protein [Gemmatimonadota bacterium]